MPMKNALHCIYSALYKKSYDNDSLRKRKGKHILSKRVNTWKSWENGKNLGTRKTKKNGDTFGLKTLLTL